MCHAIYESVTAEFHQNKFSLKTYRVDNGEIVEGLQGHGKESSNMDATKRCWGRLVYTPLNQTPSSLIVLICTQKCSWPWSWLSSRKLCGKYVEVRRPVRLDYDGPMWSVMYINAGNQTSKGPPFCHRKTNNKQIIDIVSSRHKFGCHARRRRSRKLICWMCIFH